RLLDRADPVQRHARPADERAPRLEDQRNAFRHEFDERPDELAHQGRALVAVVAEAESATEIEDLRQPAKPFEEREDALERKHALVHTFELRADVDVHALDLEPELACPRDLALR